MKPGEQNQKFRGELYLKSTEGVEHGQKCVESKNGQHFYFKNF